MKIAILGATGHIGKCLTHYFKNEHDLYLFSRQHKYIHFSYFKHESYDMVINCIGIGTVSNIKDYSDYFFVNEKYDNMIIDYITYNPKTLYVNFSSGIVPNFEGKITQDNYCAISKMYSEAKHRSLENLNIIDIRLYSFFSEFARLKDDYFINNIIVHILANKEFVTTPEEMLREYIAPKDLADFIINLESENQVYTTGSLEPVSKKEILNYFKQNHGLKYKVDPDLKISCATGDKSEYYPEDIDNIPTKTSLQTITAEASKILHKL